VAGRLRCSGAVAHYDAEASGKYQRARHPSRPLPRVTLWQDLFSCSVVWSAESKLGWRHMEAKAKYHERPWLKFYPEGVPANVEIPERSLPEVFDEVADKYSSRAAVIFYGNKISF